MRRRYYAGHSMRFLILMNGTPWGGCDRWTRHLTDRLFW